MGDLYDTDVFEWSQHQARLLQRIANGEAVNAEVDWPNVVEEIESVGRSQLSSVKSLLRQALLHDLKCEAWPLSREVPHWRSEALGFRSDAAEAFTPSMRQLIDLDTIYARALRQVPESHDGQSPLPVPTTCPVTLDELLADEP
jgi:hypothetical protein